ncbi:hypothetical protein D9757_009533 [Collybiopsis confluens]|uniref:Uncharacterized protein n=1 Tax=Collybiopsis confluens TaxID=2823264 RepID=A0A8H5M2R6_9AGAR|nr:hypothetical protein D9757_009533 [Collybiopsis confluens]
MRRKCLRRFLTTLFGPLSSTIHVSAICNGSNIGIGSLQRLSNGTAGWSFFDNSCNTVSFVDFTSAQNPCTSGIFSCSPAPVQFTGYLNQTDGSTYTCELEKSTIPESCDSTPIGSCCIKGNIDSSTPTTSTSPTSTLPTSTLPTFTVTTSSSLPSSGGSDKHSNTGAIVGGIIGGLAVLTILLLAVIFCLCRRPAVIAWRGEEGFLDDAPGISAYFIPYEVMAAAQQSGKDLSNRTFTSKRTDVVPNGSGGKSLEDGETGPGQPGPVNTEIALHDDFQRSQTEALRTIGVGVALALPAEAVAPDVAEELREEVDNIRREMEEMRMRTRLGPPPVYHSEAGYQ